MTIIMCQRCDKNLAVGVQYVAGVVLCVCSGCADLGRSVLPFSATPTRQDADVAALQSQVDALEAAGRRLLAALDEHENAAPVDRNAYYTDDTDDVYAAKNTLRDVLVDRRSP